MNLYEMQSAFLRSLGLCLNACDKKGYEFKPVCYYRSRKEQLIDFKKKKSSNKISYHEFWGACDVVRVVAGVLDWTDGPAYACLEEEAKKIGLKTGRGWTSPHDPGHIQDPLFEKVVEEARKANP